MRIWVIADSIRCSILSPRDQDGSGLRALRTTPERRRLSERACIGYNAEANGALRAGRGWPVWRNGIRDSLKNCCPHGLVGSSPTTGTRIFLPRMSMFLGSACLVVPPSVYQSAYLRTRASGQNAKQPDSRMGNPALLNYARRVVALDYGATCPTNVPQLASTVRWSFGMYSQANQTTPLSSATAAE